MLQDVMMNLRVEIRKQSVCRVKKVKGDLRQREAKGGSTPPEYRRVL